MGPTKRRSTGRTTAIPFELKLRAVKRYLEEAYTREMVSEGLGVGRSTLTTWAQNYRAHGEAGLQSRRIAPGTPKVSAAVKAKAVELKRQSPEHGSWRISHILRRMFFMQASPETVRQALQAENRVEKSRRRPKKNPARPRFFERARPNQLWQTDIFTFRLGGVPDRVFGRLLPVYHRAGVVSQPDGRACHRSLPTGDRRIRSSQGDAHRSGASVRQLARHDPVRGGDQERPGGPHQKPCASSHDAGQDRTVLEIDFYRVPGAGAVRRLRGSGREAQAMGEVLQP